DRRRDVFGLLGVAAGLSTLVSATIGVATCWFGSVIRLHDVANAWLTWWLGDTAGDVVVAPLLFVWISQPRIPWSRRRAIEALAIIAGLTAITWFIFGTRPALTLPFLVVPMLLWSVIRFHQHGAVTAAFIVAVVAIASLIDVEPNSTTTLHKRLA